MFCLKNEFLTSLLQRMQRQYRKTISHLYSRNSLNALSTLSLMFTIIPVGLILLACVFAIIVPIITKSKKTGNEKNSNNDTKIVPTVNEPQKSNQNAVSKDNKIKNPNVLTDLSSSTKEKGIKI